VSTHALLLRPSNHIYAVAALSQSKVHDADRPSLSATLAAAAGSYAAHSEMLRTEKGRRKETESAQRDKPLDGSRVEAPSELNISKIYTRSGLEAYRTF